MNRLVVLVALVSFIASGIKVSAQNPLQMSSLDRNAALNYWQAFGLLPPIDVEKRARLVSCVDGKAPVDDEMRELVKASEISLKYLYRGTRNETCSWGIAYELGPNAYMPHLSKARELAHVALVRARVRFEGGQFDEAMDDVLAATQLARHAGQEGVIVLINILVGFAIESQATEVMADSIYRLDTTQRQELEQRYGRLQPEFDLSTALQGEKDVFLGWLVREFESGQNGDRVLELVSGNVDANISKQVETASQEQLIKWAKDLSAMYDVGIGLTSLSPDEAARRQQELVDKLDHPMSGNPLGLMFLPDFGAARRAEATYLTRRALLKAAFAVFQDDESALDRTELFDPFGDGPFQLNRVEDGVEIISDMKRGDEPLALHVPGLGQ